MPKFRGLPTALRMTALAAATTLLFSTLPAAAQAPSPSKPASSMGDVRYIKSARVNVRSGPGTSHTALDSVTLGNEVRVYSTRGDWSRISAPGQAERWVYTPLLQSDAPSGPKTISKAAQKSPRDTRHQDQTRDASPQQGKPDSRDGLQDLPREQDKPNRASENEREMPKPR